MTNHLSTGAVVPHRKAETISGETLALPAVPGRTHVQFRRFAGCPICSLHLRSFALRLAEIAVAGISDAGVGFGDASTHLGLPPDFLIDPDGTIVAAHCGRHADDQWSVDQLLDIHRSPERKESC